MKNPSTIESWMIVNGKKGKEFYTEKQDKHLTALSTYYGRKITTERMMVITTGGKEPKAKYITKVVLC